MFGILRRFEEQERLDNLKKQFKDANDLETDHCVQCGYCCHRRTCIPTPDELNKIADFLELSIKETMEKYFCIDFYDGVYVMKPAGINQLDLLGDYIPTERSFNEGKCIFLKDNNDCGIYPVRPISAKDSFCGKEYKEVVRNPIPFWKDYDLGRYDDE